MQQKSFIYFLSVIVVCMLCLACAHQSSPVVRSKDAAKIAFLERQLNAQEQRITNLNHKVIVLQDQLQSLAIQSAKLDRSESIAQSTIHLPKNTKQMLHKEVPKQPKPVIVKNDTGPELLYYDGLKQLEAKKYHQAIVQLSQFSARYSQHVLAPKALYKVGEAYYEQEEWRLAITEYKKMMDTYPKNTLVPHALLKTAYAYIKLNHEQQGQQILKRLVQAYPDTPVAQSATNHLERLKQQGRSS